MRNDSSPPEMGAGKFLAYLPRPNKMHIHIIMYNRTGTTYIRLLLNDSLPPECVR